jgi:hypothetical protein
LDEFKKANAKDNEGQEEIRESIHHIWQALTFGLQKVNWDLVVDKTIGWMNMGIIVRSND